MRKIGLAVSLAAVMATPSLFAAFDGTITLTQGPYSYGSGGEFTAVTSGLGTFQTFCIEENVYFSPGSTYNYRINTGAVPGGVSGADTTDPITHQPMDNISIGTAWLYSQFRAGTLADKDGNSYFADRYDNAGVLQNAIWGLEGEITLDPNNKYIIAAQQHLTGSLTVDSGGAYDVVALNLTDGNGNPAQDQLAIVPEPTTMVAGMLLLLPFGASTLRILRRKQAA